MIFFDWHQFHADEATTPVVVDSRRRLRICLTGFVVLLLVVFLRTVHLEITQGAAFRAEATKPLQRKRSLPGVRGRILARDGTVLAYDKKVVALAVHYRYLQRPPDPSWLKRMARRRLSRAERKDPQRLKAEQIRLRGEHVEFSRRLAGLCGLSTEEWQDRAGRIQTRVERIAESHNRRRRAKAARANTRPEPSSGSFFGRLVRQLHDTLREPSDALPPAWEAVAEELDYHVMVEDVPLAVVAEIEGRPKQCPGIRVVNRSRRAYPSGRLAAHVLGHLGAVTKQELDDRQAGYHAEDSAGRMGLERQYESLLRGRRGEAIEMTDHGGRILSTYRRREPRVGRDLVLTLDSQLQRAAETLLDSALQRRAIRFERAEPAGGAIVVMDVHRGEIRSAASAPGFDPNLFVGGKASELAAVLADPSHPLFDRTSKMAIPPGSVFKTLSAVALLESSAVDPEKPFFCQGYLHQADRQRCAIYRRHGVGHGEVTLGDALAESCNVYFFHYGGQLGPEPLGRWASKFGFGRPTGVDLPGEASGTLPTPATIRDLQGHAWRPGDTQSLAIGQGALTATPLQVVRMMAAVANGGRLVTPHLVSRLGLPEVADERLPSSDAGELSDFPPPQAIPELHEQTLAVIRAGLERVVSDPDGTAHGTVYIETIATAGKTGTAETGGGRREHAWFAGYVPAEKPKLAFVIALEHSGNAATAAGPVAKRLVLQMQQLGLF